MKLTVHGPDHGMARSLLQALRSYADADCFLSDGQQLWSPSTCLRELILTPAGQVALAQEVWQDSRGIFAFDDRGQIERLPSYVPVRPDPARIFEQLSVAAPYMEDRSRFESALERWHCYDARSGHCLVAITERSAEKIAPEEWHSNLVAMPIMFVLRQGYALLGGYIVVPGGTPDPDEFEFE